MADGNVCSAFCVERLEKQAERTNQEGEAGMPTAKTRDGGGQKLGASAVGLLLLVGLVGCSAKEQLRRVRPDDLANVPASNQVQGNPSDLSEDYVGTVTSKDQWKIYSSLTDVAMLADDNPQSVAATAPDHGSDQWILADLGEVCRFQAVRQTHGAAGGPPRSYRIDVAGPKGYPWEFEWAGTGAEGESLAVFRRPVEARFLRITVLEEASSRWAVTELEVF